MEERWRIFTCLMAFFLKSVRNTKATILVSFVLEWSPCPREESKDKQIVLSSPKARTWSLRHKSAHLRTDLLS
jgi:hypothetical protein